jgi:glutamate-ammonia-ligase adenylyltransferase
MRSLGALATSPAPRSRPRSPLPARIVPFAPDESPPPARVIGMGKAGARELNYVSDVDVIFVVEVIDGIEVGRAVQVGTGWRCRRCAAHGPEPEPALWEVDANLRPEGKDGALVRTLDSHLAYYERWAKSWEFQALIKARPLAGDRRTRAALRGGDHAEGLVERLPRRVRRRRAADARARHREHPRRRGRRAAEARPGRHPGHRVHHPAAAAGARQTDEAVHQRGTLAALEALADQGYIGRTEAAAFSEHYRFLRAARASTPTAAALQRTHLMPRDRTSCGCSRARRASRPRADLVEQWQRHQARSAQPARALFYRPLLSAVAALPEEDFALTSEQASARLAAIGFVDPRRVHSAHRAMITGVSRRAQIQRNLLPVMLQWLAEGADPDYGLLTFRRLSEDLGESHWFLRMLRDSSGAAKRLTAVLSGSRYVGGLLEGHARGCRLARNEARAAARVRCDCLAEEASALRRRH